MTRKRFVKLAMANGYSRNEANEFAKSITNYKQSWKYGNWEFVRAYSEFGISVEDATKVFAHLSNAMKLIDELERSNQHDL